MTQSVSFKSALPAVQIIATQTQPILQHPARVFAKDCRRSCPTGLEHAHLPEIRKRLRILKPKDRVAGAASSCWHVCKRQIRMH
jgi:hypothetical protein